METDSTKKLPTVKVPGQIKRRLQIGVVTFAILNGTTIVSQKALILLGWRKKCERIRTRI